MTRDSHRAAVYAAEDQLSRLLASGGVIDFHGSTLDIAPEQTFQEIAEIQEYLDAIRWTSWGHGDLIAARMCASRATTTAEWRAPNLIRVPVKQGWAMRESVVLHEYSHHVQFHRTGATSHDEDFCQTLLGLVEYAMSPAVALLLRAGLTDNGALNSFR